MKARLSIEYLASAKYPDIRIGSETKDVDLAVPLVPEQTVYIEDEYDHAWEGRVSPVVHAIFHSKFTHIPLYRIIVTPCRRNR